MMQPLLYCRIILPINPTTRLTTLVFPSKSVFDPQMAMKRYNKKIDWRKVLKGPEMDDEDELRNRTL